MLTDHAIAVDAAFICRLLCERAEPDALVASMRESQVYRLAGIWLSMKADREYALALSTACVFQLSLDFTEPSLASSDGDVYELESAYSSGPGVEAQHAGYALAQLAHLAIESCAERELLSLAATAGHEQDVGRIEMGADDIAGPKRTPQSVTMDDARSLNRVTAVADFVDAPVLYSFVTDRAGLVSADQSLGRKVAGQSESIVTYEGDGGRYLFEYDAAAKRFSARHPSVTGDGWAMRLVSGEGALLGIVPLIFDSRSKSHVAILDLESDLSAFGSHPPDSIRFSFAGLNDAIRRLRLYRGRLDTADGAPSAAVVIWIDNMLSRLERP